MQVAHIWMKEILGFEGLSVFDNGASIRDVKTGELIWSKWLEPQVVQQVAAIVTTDAIWIDYAPDYGAHEPTVDELEQIARIDRAAPYVFARVPKNQMTELNERLAAIPNITYYDAASTDGNLEYRGIQINHIEADKFHGVAALRNINGIDIQHTLAIGDDTNDLAFFRNAGTKIAMGNATDGLKAVADHVVADVEHDGFVEAMERFVLR